MIKKNICLKKYTTFKIGGRAKYFVNANNIKEIKEAINYAEKNNIPLDEINPPLESLNGQQRFWAEKSIEQDLDDYDRIEEDTFNRIIWHAVKGYNRPYPVLSEK